MEDLFSAWLRFNASTLQRFNEVNLVRIEAVRSDKFLERLPDAHGPSLEWIGISQGDGPQR